MPPAGYGYYPPTGRSPSRSSSSRSRRGRGGQRGGQKRRQGKGGGKDGGPATKTALSKQMTKTKMCDFHAQGKCTRGAQCSFAHSQEELQAMPDLRKTRICRAFTQGKCNDANCKFAHGTEELRETGLCYKTQLCTWHEKELRAHGGDPDAPDSGVVPKAKPQAKAKGAGKGGRRGRPQKRKAEEGSGSEDVDQRQPKSARVESAECPRCGTTMATGLGIRACVLCRC
ncbi:unnamed protein product [Prorocentrum cordatum]|uniref:C3H1-type domain-containing protein n=1 Tax=Prorocentrum cordatum TaxID=2364126 RepID=A0ABN9TZK8_9DINO|nr:unnamed protein product [Polarella glacialis]